jgi:uncharacterized protein DUF2779
MNLSEGNKLNTSESPYNPYLSKSQFVRGLQCHKSLWLHKYQPELRDEISAEQEAVFQSGTNVGILAQQLFPGGAEVPYEGLTHAEQIERTLAEIDKGTSTIYEATFSHDDIFVKVDILHRGESGWELYEVKSSTEVKDVYLNDIAVQYYVASGSGLTISRAALIHIDNKYVKTGEIEIDRLFAIQDKTAGIVGMQGLVTAELARMREMLRAEAPSIDIGPHCSKPYPCDFQGQCWAHIPENSIFDLGGNGVNKFAQYRKGIIRLEDVPLDILPRGQRIQAKAFQTGLNHIDVDAAREFLASLWYPLCFLDFETTYMTPVPLFDGTRPYQQVPFQYSLHTLTNEGAALKHCEFLAQPGEDPQLAFIDSLLAALPDNACILAYNQKFEIGRMKEIAESFPEHQERIAVLIDNFRDLMKPFESRTIYFPEMGGSYSIKAVLPALVPELGYKGLEVSNGAMAAEAYLRMLQMDDPDEISRTRTALLEYCKLDTLAMVRILEKMREMVKLK